MARDWIRENPPRWDDDKERILGGAPDGVFDLEGLRRSGVLPGEWWRLEDAGRTVGYGWMDVTWGYAPVLVAVDPAQRGRGHGTSIMDHLESEAHEQGLAYIFNVIPAAHPDPDGLSAWLQARGFEPSASDDRLLRRHVTGG